MRRETMTMRRGIQMLTTTSSALFPAFLHIFTLILLCRFLWIRWKLWAKTLLSPWYAICKPKHGSLDGSSSNWCHGLTLNETLIKRWRLLPRFPSELIIIIAPRPVHLLSTSKGGELGWLLGGGVGWENEMKAFFGSYYSELPAHGTRISHNIDQNLFWKNLCQI